MSRLVARILLALLMLPLAAVVYMLTVVWLLGSGGGRRGEAGFMIAGAVTAVFVAVWWILLWRSTVRWTGKRIGATVAAAVASLLVGSAVGAGASSLDDEFGIFVGGVVWILLWLATTVLIWRETADERSLRIRRAGGHTLACPRCGYNMTGLRESLCPECGGSYTISELLASQAGHEPAEIEESPGTAA